MIKKAKISRVRVPLKIYLRGVFDFWFSSKKESTWSPDKLIEFVSNIKLILPKYLNLNHILNILSIGTQKQFLLLAREKNIFFRGSNSSHTPGLKVEGPFKGCYVVFHLLPFLPSLFLSPFFSFPYLPFSYTFPFFSFLFHIFSPKWHRVISRGGDSYFPIYRLLEMKLRIFTINTEWNWVFTKYAIP